MRYFFFYLAFVVCFAAFVPEVFSQVTESSVEATAEQIDILPAKAKYLGEKEENGVIAKAWIYRVPIPDLQTNPAQQMPYLLFVQFSTVNNDIRIEKGIAAYKLESFDEERTRAHKLDFKSGYFVAGLDAKTTDYANLLVGCKLEDEKKRQYRYKMKLN